MPAARKRKGCDKKAVRKSWIENLVVDETLAMLQDDKVIAYIIELVMEIQGAENTSLPLLQQQLTETQKGIDNMLNAIQAGISTQSTKQRLDELEQAKAEIVKAYMREVVFSNDPLKASCCVIRTERPLVLSFATKVFCLTILPKKNSLIITRFIIVCLLEDLSIPWQLLGIRGFDKPA
jgi:hypothetical protein